MPPSARQNTNGPAMSVSWSICCSVPRSGLSTAKVCKKRKTERGRVWERGEDENIVSLLDWNYSWETSGLWCGLLWHGIYSCDNPSSSFTSNTTCGRIRHNLFVPGTAAIKPKTHGQPSTVFEQFNQNLVLFFLYVFVCVCVCAFAVKFEKWKLMINDIADQWRAASRAANTKLSTFVWRHSATEINETTETKQFPPLPIPWGTHVWATKLINVKSFFDY